MNEFPSPPEPPQKLSPKYVEKGLLPNSLPCIVVGILPFIGLLVFILLGAFGVI